MLPKWIVLVGIIALFHFATIIYFLRRFRSSRTDKFSVSRGTAGNSTAGSTTTSTSTGSWKILNRNSTEFSHITVNKLIQTARGLTPHANLELSAIVGARSYDIKIASSSTSTSSLLCAVFLPCMAHELERLTKKIKMFNTCDWAVFLYGGDRSLLSSFKSKFDDYFRNDKARDHGRGIVLLEYMDETIRNETLAQFRSLAPPLSEAYTAGLRDVKPDPAAAIAKRSRIPGQARSGSTNRLHTAATLHSRRVGLFGYQNWFKQSEDSHHKMRQHRQYSPVEYDTIPHNRLIYPKTLMLPRLLPLLKDYKRVWLQDHDISLDGFNLQTYLQLLDCAFAPLPPPLVSQPLIADDTQSYKYLNAKGWKEFIKQLRAKETAAASVTPHQAQDHHIASEKNRGNDANSGNARRVLFRNKGRPDGNTTEAEDAAADRDMTATPTKSNSKGGGYAAAAASNTGGARRRRSLINIGDDDQNFSSTTGSVLPFGGVHNHLRGGGGILVSSSSAGSSGLHPLWNKESDTTTGEATTTAPASSRRLAGAADDVSIPSSNDNGRKMKSIVTKQATAAITDTSTGIESSSPLPLSVAAAAAVAEEEVSSSNPLEIGVHIAGVHDTVHVLGRDQHQQHNNNANGGQNRHHNKNSGGDRGGGDYRRGGNRATVYAAATKFVEIQTPFVDSMFLDWYIRFILVPLLGPSHVLGADWGFDATFCGAGKAFAMEAMHSGPDIVPCAVIIHMKEGLVHHENDHTLDQTLGRDTKLQLNKEMMNLVEKTFPTFYLKGHAKTPDVNPLIQESDLLKIIKLPAQCEQSLEEDLAGH